MPTLLATNALGTRVELVLDAPTSPGLMSIGEEAIDEILLWHDRLSLYQPHSLLSFINREAGRRAVALDDDVFGLLALCGRVHELSGGAFDPTVGREQLCGDVSRDLSGPEVGRSSLVELDGARRTVRFVREGVRLDLGGIAKGFALDMAAELLRSHLDCEALVHAGTSGVVVIGGVPRLIGVRSGSGVRTVSLADASLCVSAPRGGSRCGVVGDGVGDDGGRGGAGGPGGGCISGSDDCVSHLVRPMCAGDGGGMADTSLVIGGSCAEADGWATALAVLGRRPAGMPVRLRSAVHDGREWRCDGVWFVSPDGSEAEPWNRAEEIS